MRTDATSTPARASSKPAPMAGRAVVTLAPSAGVSPVIDGPVTSTTKAAETETALPARSATWTKTVWPPSASGAGDEGESRRGDLRQRGDADAVQADQGAGRVHSGERVAEGRADRRLPGVQDRAVRRLEAGNERGHPVVDDLEPDRGAGEAPTLVRRGV